jgi:autophagy-related protein 5
MMNLTKAAQIQLWDALWTHNFERYWKVNDGLVKTPDSSDFSKSNFSHRAPVRCYLVGNGTPLRIVQWPLRLDDATIETLCNQLRLGQAEQLIRVLLHGLELDPSTPLLWLATNAAYADNFLHLVVHVSTRP